MSLVSDSFDAGADGQYTHCMEVSQVFNRKRFNPDLKAASRAIAYLNACEREMLKYSGTHRLAYMESAKALDNAKKWLDEARYLAKFPENGE